jgi:hypothetical protein
MWVNLLRYINLKKYLSVIFLFQLLYNHYRMKVWEEIDYFFMQRKQLIHFHQKLSIYRTMLLIPVRFMSAVHNIKLTTWSRALVAKLIVTQLIKFPAFCGTRIFITVFTRSHLCPYSEPH